MPAMAASKRYITVYAIGGLVTVQMINGACGACGLLIRQRAGYFSCYYIYFSFWKNKLKLLQT